MLKKFFPNSMKKSLKARGYKHCSKDEEFTHHGEYARNIQYAFSKEFLGANTKIIDVVFLAMDFYHEQIVIGFLRENVSIDDGLMLSSNVNIPLAKFSLEEFEKQLDRLIPEGDPLWKIKPGEQEF